MISPHTPERLVDQVKRAAIIPRTHTHIQTHIHIHIPYDNRPYCTGENSKKVIRKLEKKAKYRKLEKRAKYFVMQFQYIK